MYNLKLSRNDRAAIDVTPEHMWFGEKLKDFLESKANCSRADAWNQPIPIDYKIGYDVMYELLDMYNSSNRIIQLPKVLADKLEKIILEFEADSVDHPSWF